MLFSNFFFNTRIELAYYSIDQLIFQAAVARSFCKSIDVYDQDIHLRTLRT